MISWTVLRPAFPSALRPGMQERLRRCASEAPTPDTSPTSARPHLRIVEGRPRKQAREDDSLPFPIVSYTMLAVISVVFAAMWWVGKGDINRVARLFGDKDDTLIQAGQVWRFVTAIFLHGSLTHLVVNGLSLVWLGAQMERVYGARKYFIIYMVAGIVGYLTSYVRSAAPSLGASGAIFGLVGAGLVFPLRYRSLVPEKTRSLLLSQLLLITLVNLGIGFSMKGVDNFAHMGGLVGGGFTALFLLPEALEREKPSRLHEAALWMTVAALLAVIVWAGVAQWRWVKEITPPPMVQFPPASAHPWWSIGIPTRWKPDKEGWRSPEGVTLTATDSLTTPQLAQEAWLRILQAGPKAEVFLIDGLQTYHISLQDTRRRNTVIDLYLFRTYNQAVLLMLRGESSAFSKTQRDLRFILDSMRLLHAPPRPTPAEAAPSVAPLPAPSDDHKH